MLGGTQVGRRLGWRRVGVAVAMMTLVALLSAGSVILAGCSSNGSQADSDGEANAEMYALAGDLMDAMNGRNTDAGAALYTEDAVFDDLFTGDQSQGRDEILQKATDMVGLGATFGFSGKPIQVGDVLIQPVTFLSNGRQVGQGTWVFLVNGENQVTHQWLNGKVRDDSQADGTPSNGMTSLVADFFKANNAADKDATAALYAEAAVLDSNLESPPVHVEGRDNIAKMTTEFTAGGSTFGPIGQAIQLGDYVIQPVTFLDNGEHVGEGVHVFLINKDNQITHQWVSGGVDPQ